MIRKRTEQSNRAVEGYVDIELGIQEASPGPGLPSREALEALLYDWHNYHKLRAQHFDVSYLLQRLERAARLLVLGAGTGRVAVPLAAGGRVVVALDRSVERLRRIPARPRLHPLAADFRAAGLSRFADAAVFPYSSFQLLATRQDRLAALGTAHRALRPRGMLLVDVSPSFERRTTTDGWRLALEAPCAPLGMLVREHERAARADDHVVLQKTFSGTDGRLLLVEERWALLSAIDLPGLLADSGFELAEVEEGYGGDRSAHRRVFVAYAR